MLFLLNWKPKLLQYGRIISKLNFPTIVWAGEGATVNLDKREKRKEEKGHYIFIYMKIIIRKNYFVKQFFFKICIWLYISPNMFTDRVSGRM